VPAVKYAQQKVPWGSYPNLQRHAGEGPADLHQRCHASPVAHGPKLPQKADAKAPDLLGGTVALPVPPQPPARAAQARALAKEWGPNMHTNRKRGSTYEVANLARSKAQPQFTPPAGSRRGRASPKGRCQWRERRGGRPYPTRPPQRGRRGRQAKLHRPIWPSCTRC
jgi:hypothetical protein